MKNTGFKCVFFGIIFILLYIPMMKIDILPDAIGYIFLLFGFKALAKNSSYFVKGKIMSIVMIIVSIISMYLQIAMSDKFDIPMFSIFEKVVEPIQVISFSLEIYITYLLFSGIKDMCKQREKTELYVETEQIWKMYVYMLIGSVLVALFIFLPIISLIIIIVLTIASVVLFFKTIRLIKKCENELL